MPDSVFREATQKKFRPKNESAPIELKFGKETALRTDTLHAKRQSRRLPNPTLNPNPKP